MIHRSRIKMALPHRFERNISGRCKRRSRRVHHLHHLHRHPNQSNYLSRKETTMNARQLVALNILFLVSILFGMISMSVALDPIKTGSYYSFELNFLDCNNLDYMSGCRHEIGHKMDDDMGVPSLSPEFGHAVQLYILTDMLDKNKKPGELASILFLHPGVYVYDATHPYQVQRELYASIYSWANGDVSKIPEIFQPFYSTKTSYLDLYDCLSKPTRLNVCGFSISHLKGE
jgi:hypothetical protein